MYDGVIVVPDHFVFDVDRGGCSIFLADGRADAVLIEVGT
jgi:hypothetical protein